MSSTHSRSQRWAGSASARGCQNSETVMGAMATGSAKQCMPVRSAAVWRSGTLATSSAPRARPTAAEKPPTVATTLRASPSAASASSTGPLSCARRATSTCRPPAYRAGVISPWHSGCPGRTTPTKRSTNRARMCNSGPVAWPTTPVSRSTVPLRSGALSLSSRGTKRSCTPGASWPMRASNAGPKPSTKPSLVRSVKARCSRRGCRRWLGRRAASASCTILPTWSRSASARGDGTRPRPARTSSGSPRVSRSRASARLIAEGLSRSLRAAAATLPSASRTSRVTSRFRSGLVMGNGRHTWRWMHE